MARVGFLASAAVLLWRMGTGCDRAKPKDGPQGTVAVNRDKMVVLASDLAAFDKLLVLIA